MRTKARITASVAAAILWWLPNPVCAGPPLVLDDPNTVGPGVVQPIFAVRTVSQGSEVLLVGPLADVTVGLVDSLDATMIVSFTSLRDSSTSPPWSFGALVVPGVKWEFFRGKRGSLAFSPAFVFDTKIIRQPAGLLSVQGEITVGHRKTVIGFDLGYVPVRRNQDEWFAGFYLNQPVTRRLNVLGEVWAVSFGRAESADVGISAGIDFGIDGDRLRLLADVGTGLVSINGPRIDVRAYVGTQFTFGTRRDRWRSKPSARLE